VLAGSLLGSKNLSAIQADLSGPQEPPKGVAAWQESMDRIDDLAYNFEHPPENLTGKDLQDHLKTQLNGMQKEFQEYAKLSMSREVYGNAEGLEGAKIYFTHKQSILHKALVHLSDKGRMRDVGLEDIDALHHQIAQLSPSNAKPGDSNPKLAAH
jgi:hypothetical protein